MEQVEQSKHDTSKVPTLLDHTDNEHETPPPPKNPTILRKILSFFLRLYILLQCFLIIHFLQTVMII